MVASKDTRFDALSSLATEPVYRAIVELVEHGEDRDLHRVNLLELAANRDLPLDPLVDGFVHATKLGLFDASWNLLCPGCGGVLDARTAIREVRESYQCSLCATAYEPKLDEMIEVSFTVSPSVRGIRTHQPDQLSPTDYYRYMYFGQGLTPPSWERFLEQCLIEAEAIPAGERVILSLQLPDEFSIVFDPVTHGVTFIDVKGEPTRERRDLTITFRAGGSDPARLELAPGPLRLTFANTTGSRILPGLFRAGDELHAIFQHRRSFFTAKHLLTNQTFRDVYRTDTLSIDQRLAIASLTVLFTDLKSSTELYERVGDLMAYDLVQKHFRTLAQVVRDAGGAVVKTIGDAIMATFPSPDRGLAAALEMRDAMARFNRDGQRGDLLMLKIGLHAGPCLAVMLNERLDYFGQTVNVAARVQGLAGAQEILTTAPVLEYPGVRSLVQGRGLAVTPKRAQLRGIAHEVTVFDVR